MCYREITGLWQTNNKFVTVRNKLSKSPTLTSMHVQFEYEDRVLVHWIDGGIFERLLWTVTDLSFRY